MNGLAQAIALPRVRRFRRPPRRIVMLLVRTLAEMAVVLYYVLTVAGVVPKFGVWPPIKVALGLIWLKWTVDDYKAMVKAIEAWQKNRVVASPSKREWVHTGLVVLISLQTVALTVVSS